ncbi:hypothetical protein [Actinoplanes sp. NPDC020271]|uniref:hypothetical protein n=1 Tax=Actinoplanes sp. NPDC020271 TaxID=3363896 RepID=UPI0037B834B4
MSFSAATDPQWDNRSLFPALARMKRLRRAAAGRDQIRGASPRVAEQAAVASGVWDLVAGALRDRHQAVADSFRILREIPEVPGLEQRRAAVRADAQWLMARGAEHLRGWSDFGPLNLAADELEVQERAGTAARIAAITADRRAFAFAQARNEAVFACAVRVSGGRRVDLEFDRPFTGRTLADWWWVDDPGRNPIIGDLDVAADGLTATWIVTGQTRRLGPEPQLLTGPDRIRISCLPRVFQGRPWKPPVGFPAPPPSPAMIETIGPDGQLVVRWRIPPDLDGLDSDDA